MPNPTLDLLFPTQRPDTSICFDRSNGDLVLIVGGVISGRYSATGIKSLSDGEARGDILRYEASAWNNHPAKTAGHVLGGDGADVKSMPVTGQVSLTHSAGNLQAAIEIASQARGDLVRRGAAAWERVAAKASGQLVSGDGNDVVSAPMTGEVTVAAAGGNLVATMGGAKDAGAQAVGHVDSTGVGADTETVTVGARVYELDTHDAPGVITAGRVRVDVSAGSTVKSQGTLNLNSNPLDTETVTIDGKAYTFQTVLTDVDGHVLIGGTASATIDNLIAAINLGAGGGTAYAASTTVHPTVSAAIGAGDTMIATAKAGGVGGDLIATLDGLSDVLSVWDAVTLGTTTAGVSPTATEVATALVTAVNADASRECDAYDVTDGTVLLTAKTAGASMPALATTGANLVVSAAATVGGAAAAVRSVYTFVRTITAADVTVLSDANGTVAIGAIPSTTQPTFFQAQAITAAGLVKYLDDTEFLWVQPNANYWVLTAVDAGGGAVGLAAGDTVRVLVIG